MTFRKSTSRFSLGRAAYHLWFKPLNRLKDIARAGGPIEVWRTEQGRLAMEAAAYALPPLPSSSDGTPLELHLLTGKRFWYQTAFCLWSFARQSGRAIQPVIYDDGSLTADYREALQIIIPSVQFQSQSEILQRLDAFLPVSRFPTLRERWIHYPNIRKLTDVHVGRSGWKLVIDSDLLFFRPPTFLVNWLDLPEMPLHAVDCETSYGYSRALMSHHASAPIADLVNVGLTGLNGSELDWERLEYWCTDLILKEKTHYFLEQALIAMMLAGRKCAIAPGDQYVTKPDSKEAGHPTAVMHHYVAHSKSHYFQRCWRKALRKGS